MKIRGIILFFIVCLLTSIACVRIWQWEGDPKPRPEFYGSPMEAFYESDASDSEL